MRSFANFKLAFFGYLIQFTKPNGFFTALTFYHAFGGRKWAYHGPSDLWKKTVILTVFMQTVISGGKQWHEMRDKSDNEDGQQIYSISKFQPKRRWSGQFMASQRPIEFNLIGWIQCPSWRAANKKVPDKLLTCFFYLHQSHSTMFN